MPQTITYETHIKAAVKAVRDVLPKPTPTESYIYMLKAIIYELQADLAHAEREMGT